MWALPLAGATPAAAQDLGYTASLFVTRATTPVDTYDSLYVFNSLDISTGPLRLTFSVPFGRQHFVAEETVNALDGSVIAAVDEVTTGFGDPLVRADVRVIDDRARGLQLAAVGSVKLPVVDAANGLGTGEADYAFGVSGYKAIGRTALLLDALYWLYGDPEGIDFDNTLSYSVGVARIVGQGRWSTMLSLSGFSSGFDGAAPPTQLNVGVLALVGRRQSLAVSAGIGLTDSAGDVSVGTSWRIAR